MISKFDISCAKAALEVERQKIKRNRGRCGGYGLGLSNHCAALMLNDISRQQAALQEIYVKQCRREA